jgi:pimeloyl-ACP methyl ester carboxylesterase
MPYANRDGVRLFYSDSGSGEPPLLLVHGWCCDHTDWRNQVRAFRQGHRVVAVDLRGHGRSGAPQQDYTTELFCSDLEWLIGQLGLRRPVVVGHSMGAGISLRLAARGARALSGVVLVDSPLVPARRTPRTKRDALQRAALIRALETPAYLEAASAFSDTWFTPGSPSALRERVRRRLAAVPQHVMASAFRQLPADGRSALAALRVPALFIDGGMRRWWDYVGLSRAAPALQFARPVGTGDHFPQLEAVEQFNAMLRAFLRQLRRRR